MLTHRMKCALGCFQHRDPRRLTRRQPRRRGDGSCEYPPLEEAMVEAGFEGIVKYITRWHNTAAPYIATRPILDLCERSAQSPGMRLSWRCWGQVGLDLEGAKERSAAAAAYSDGEDLIGEE